MANRRWVAAALLAACALAAGSATASAQDSQRFTATVELGPTWQTRNDTRIPGDSGTGFSLLDLTGRGAILSGRMDVSYNIGGGAQWRLLVAPLSVSGTGRLRETTQFAGASFAAGVPTAGSYRFNSYRLTYRNRFHKDARSEWRIGATLKVRDARIGLRQGGVAASDYDLGFVPLVNLTGEVRLADRWRFLLDFDGLAAPQGRAFDLGLSLAYDLSPSQSVHLGYRTLEGGADNDRVYTFAWIHYLTAGMSYRF